MITADELLNIFDQNGYFEFNIGKWRQRLIDNYDTITRKSYNDRYLSDTEVMFKLLCHQAKYDHIITAFISKITNDLPCETTIDGRIYSLLTGEQNVCSFGNIAKFRDIEVGFDGCGGCDKCKCVGLKISRVMRSRTQLQRQEQTQRKEATFLRKYGVTNPAKSAVVQAKAKATNALKTKEEKEASLLKREDTCLKRWGNKNFLASTPGRTQIKASLIKNLGVDNPAKSAKIKAKIKSTNNSKSDQEKEAIKTTRKNTNLVKYGVENTWQADFAKEKIKQTTMTNWGYEHSSQVPELKTKRGDTCEEIYGVRNPGQSCVIRQKASDTYEQKTGYKHQWSDPSIREGIRLKEQEEWKRDHHGQRHYSDETLSILNDGEKLAAYIKDFSISELAEKLLVDRTTILNYCRDYQIPISSRSTFETAIENFLIRNQIAYQMNTRKIIKPLELDFYLPDFKIGIEFNSYFYHNDTVITDTMYHYNKWKLCNEKGIQLIAIDENDWMYRNDLVKNLLLTQLNLLQPKNDILSISQIDNFEAIKFCDEYHLEGKPTNVKYSYGAFCNDTLIGVLVIGTQYPNKLDEITRFCSNGEVYANLFSSIFNHYINDKSPEIVISCADSRYDDGTIYGLHDFTKQGILPPGFNYILRNKSFDPQGFTKKNIARKFKIDVDNKTQTELMSELGYKRIWDCGKILFIWESVQT